MVNIVIPCAGLGSRFQKAGYIRPKPLIDVRGRPMISHVVENVSSFQTNHRFIFIVQKQLMLEYGELFRSAICLCRKNECRHDDVIIEIDGLTDGAARTVLKAEKYINNDEPLLIVNSDQLVADHNFIDEFLFFCQTKKAHGIIPCFLANDKKWSFVKIDETGRINDIKEKEVISNLATVGHYYYSRGSDFVRAAGQMIRDNFRINGEVYVAPTYQYLIKEGMVILPYMVNWMQALGTPEDLQRYLNENI